MSYNTSKTNKGLDCQRKEARHEILYALLISFILILLVFPDVIFKGASLRITDQIVGQATLATPQSVYPVPEHSHWWDAYQDNGGALFQSEPMIEFMRFCFRTGNSPFWNPYAAAGSLGPDSLVDQKLSLFTAINALLGGGSLIYNVTLIISYAVAVFFLFRIAREKLRLSYVAASATAIFYLLNGYSATNIGSNIIPGYLYGPPWLYLSICFLDKRSTISFVGVAISFAVLFSNTFVPVTLLTAVSLYAIIIGYIIAQRRERVITLRMATKILGIHGVAMFAGAVCLSIIYLPAISNLASSGTLAEYSKRLFQPAYGLGIPSLFSPSLVYESYNAAEPRAITWYSTGSVIGGPASISGNLVYHFGIISTVLIGCAWCNVRNRTSTLVGTCVVVIMIALCRIFGVFGISQVISVIPVIGNIGENYWWAAVFIPAAILVGFGVENLVTGSGILWPSVVIVIFGSVFTIKRLMVFGLHEPFYSFKLTSLFVAAIAAGLSLGLCALASRARGRMIVLVPVLCLVFSMFAELSWDAKVQRFERSDFFSRPSPEVSFLKQHVGLYRTLNFGQTGLYPELGSAFQIAEASTMNEGLMSSYKNYFFKAISLPNDQVLSYIPKLYPHGFFPNLFMARDTPELHFIDRNAIDLMGIKYLVLPSNFINYRAKLIAEGEKLVFESSSSVIFENNRVLPRAFSLPLGNLPRDGAIQLTENYRRNIESANIVSYDNTNVSISGQATRSSLVVLTDSWQSGWHATLNGKDAQIMKINGVFRGVLVPPGPFKIIMDYRLPIEQVAKALSVGMIFCLSLLVVFRRRADDLISGWAL